MDCKDPSSSSYMYFPFSSDNILMNEDWDHRLPSLLSVGFADSRWMIKVSSALNIGGRVEIVVLQRLNTWLFRPCRADSMIIVSTDRYVGEKGPFVWIPSRKKLNCLDSLLRSCSSSAKCMNIWYWKLLLRLDVGKWTLKFSLELDGLTAVFMTGSGGR